MAAPSTSVMKVFDVMTTNVVTAGNSETISDAVGRMLDKDVGCIVVVHKDAVAGIITKGDVLKKAYLTSLDPKKTFARDVMTAPVVAISADASLEDAAKLMTQKHVSKLPVLRDRKLVGIVTSTDVIRAEPMQVKYLQELVRARFVPHDLR